MGDYDIVAIYEAPDDAVAARFNLQLGMLGNVRREVDAIRLRPHPHEFHLYYEARRLPEESSRRCCSGPYSIAPSDCAIR
jgi:hypothetical protein